MINAITKPPKISYKNILLVIKAFLNDLMYLSILTETYKIITPLDRS
jgi:hypothetical protein